MKDKKKKDPHQNPNPLMISISNFEESAVSIYGGNAADFNNNSAVAQGNSNAADDPANTAVAQEKSNASRDPMDSNVDQEVETKKKH